MRPAHLDSTAAGTYSDSHGTPDWILAAVRQVCGPIGLDAASSTEANQRVKAVAYMSVDNDALDSRTPWHLEHIPDDHSLFCNPPGGKARPPVPIQFWRRLTDELRLAPQVPAAFLFFNIDHLRHIRPAGLQWACYLLHKRQVFHNNKAGASFASALMVRPRDLSWGLADTVLGPHAVRLDFNHVPIRG